MPRGPKTAIKQGMSMQESVDLTPPPEYQATAAWAIARAQAVAIAKKLEQKHPTALQVVVCCEMGMTPLLWGGPGTGKTTLGQDLALKKQVPFVQKIAGQMDQDTIIGIPVEVSVRLLRESTERLTEVIAHGLDRLGRVLAADGTGPDAASDRMTELRRRMNGSHSVSSAPVVAFVPPDWQVEMATAGEGIIFLDDFTTVKPRAEADLLEIIRTHRTQTGCDLSGCWFIAAANRAEDAPNGRFLAPPTVNRFVNITMADLPFTPRTSMTPEQRAASFPDLPVMPPLEEMLGSPEFVMHTSLMETFLKEIQPGLKHKMPETRGQDLKGWASLRSWEYVVRIMTACDYLDLSFATRSAVVKGAVGDGPGDTYLTWVRSLDLPHVSDLLMDPDRSDLSRLRSDQLYVVCETLASTVLFDPTADKVTRGLQVLLKAHGQGAAVDTLAKAMKTICEGYPEKAKGTLADIRGDVLAPTVDILGKIYKDAGLLQKLMGREG